VHHLAPVLLAAAQPLTILMTVIGLGGLIFIHELGHFLACIVTGTRVETFSIGFGPKVFGWKRGRTLYKVGAIPLGGYVKMAAENPGESRTGAPDELPQKSFSQRLLIFTAGVIFNTVLGFLLFVCAFAIGIPFESPVVGAVVHGEAGWEAGLRRGDRILAIDGRKIFGFDDVKLEVAYSPPDRPLRFTIERDGRPMDLPILPRYNEEVGIPWIAVEPALEAAAAGVTDDSPAAKAGARKGDRILSVQGVAVADAKEALSRIASAAAEAPEGAASVPLKLRVRRSTGEEADLSIDAPAATAHRLGLAPAESTTLRAVGAGSPFAGLLRPGDILDSVNGEPLRDLGDLRETARRALPLERIGIRRDGAPSELRPRAPATIGDLADAVAGTVDLSSMRVAPTSGMPAGAAGILAGDRVRKVGGKEVARWEEMLEAIRERGGEPVALTIEREGRTFPVEVKPKRIPDPQSLLASLGYEFALETTTHRETNVFRALAGGWRLTKLTIESVLLTLKGLVTQRISTKLIGGPIALAQAAYTTWERGLAHYLKILALISLNLAILNILPIPVLDGGQVVFLIAEKIRGKPLSERVIGIFQFVGLAMILALVFIAFKNDISRLLHLK